MAHELFAQYATGQTLYAVLRNNATGQAHAVVTGTASLEAFNSAHWASEYAQALTEVGSCGMYQADLSPVPAADAAYDVFTFLQAGGSPAVGDSLVSQGAVWIEGGAVVGREVNVTQLLGTAWLTPGTAGTPDANVISFSTAAATAIAAAVWGAATATYAGAGTFGLLVGGVVASVWSYATRILTAGTNIVLAKGTGVTGFNDIAATAIVSNGAITTSGGKAAAALGSGDYSGNTPQTGDAYARLGAPAGASVSADIAAVESNASSAATSSASAASSSASAATSASTAATEATAAATALGTAGSGLTNLGDTRIAHLDANVSSRSTYAGGAVASVTAAVEVGAYASGQDPGTLLAAGTQVDGYSIFASQRIIAAVVAGKITDAGTGTNIFVGLDGLTTRITATVDGTGNRSVVVYV